MTQPSIKGIVLSNLINDVAALQASGKISAEEIEARLEKSDLDLLENKPKSTDWVPIDHYRRLSELLWEIEGKRSPAYLERRGRASAELVLASGIYQQVEFLKERYDASDLKNARASLNLVVTLQGSLINFGNWQVEEDPKYADRLQIRITEATHFPEALCHAMVGFLNRMAETRSTSTKWYFERTGRDLLAFRMSLPIT